MLYPPITKTIVIMVDNAFSYTSAGNSVTLALEILDGSVRIIVRDTGPGLRPDEMDLIWQRHTRGSAASARTPGMGLGLSLVRAVAIAHGGTTGCVNRKSGGSEFWIELPLARAVKGTSE